MKFRILLKLNTKRTSPVKSGYRPDWYCESKPDYNGGQIILEDDQEIFPGQEIECVLIPLKSEFWSTVSINNILKCMEGPNQVGEAIVLEILTGEHMYSDFRK